jgi:hypothetical protein
MRFPIWDASFSSHDFTHLGNLLVYFPGPFAFMKIAILSYETAHPEVKYGSESDQRFPYVYRCTQNKVPVLPTATASAFHKDTRVSGADTQRCDEFIQ